ncbi:MAG: hypothetical protein SNJ57_03845 [Cyanobacteriota bacterium]
MAKKTKHDLKWVKETLSLPKNHNWKSQDGYNIFVAGRGAVRFDVPADWIFEPDEKSFKFFDGKPPNDNCRLEVSYNLLPEGDWTLFPLVSVMKELVEKDERNILEKGEIVSLKRQTARIVWTEFKFLDSQENREAYSRICIGLGSGVQCLITFDYWVDDAERLTPVWDMVMKTLTLGLFIRDPRQGFAFPD